VWLIPFNFPRIPCSSARWADAENGENPANPFIYGDYQAAMKAAVGDAFQSSKCLIRGNALHAALEKRRLRKPFEAEPSLSLFKANRF
jgi:hypothetical protein